jgi:iron complex transport system ATP-binding protein
MVMRLEVRNAAFAYGHGDEFRWIFRNVSFSLEPGAVFCLLGPNGTGKSTLLKCIAGFLPLREGSVHLGETPTAHLSRREFARHVAYVPQHHVPSFPYAVLDVVLMGRTPHLSYLGKPGFRDRRIAWAALERLGISSLAAKPYTEISGGERQLVLLASVLSQEPRILLLDEPTTHLDFGNQIRFLEILRRLAGEGMAVLMSTHAPEQAFLAGTTAAILKEGHLSPPASPERVITEQAILDTYGVAVRIVADSSGETKGCVPLRSGK